MQIDTGKKGTWTLWRLPGELPRLHCLYLSQPLEQLLVLSFCQQRGLATRSGGNILSAEGVECTLDRMDCVFRSAMLSHIL